MNQTDDPLRMLEAQLERASAAAERLIAEAAAEAGAAATRMGDRIKPPPAGWQTGRAAEEPGSSSGSAAGAGTGGSELQMLLSVFESVRDLVPPELRRRVAEALRELLLALRALIDWYLERLEQGRRDPVEVEDIPIL